MDLGHLSTGDGEARDVDRLVTKGHDSSSRSVYEDRQLRQGDIGDVEGPASDGGRAAELHGGLWQCTAAVGSQHDVGVEYRHQSFQVTSVHGSEERVDNLSLSGEVGGGGPGCLLPERGDARLASWRVVAAVRPTMGAISSKVRSNRSWRTKASRSAGERVPRAVGPVLAPLAGCRRQPKAPGLRPGSCRPRGGVIVIRDRPRWPGVAFLGIGEPLVVRGQLGLRWRPPRA